MVKSGFPSKESSYNARDVDSISGLESVPGKANGNPFQYSCWEISWTEEPGGLQSIGSQESWTQLSY